MRKSTPISKGFPERLRQARELRKLNQGNLAKRTGMQPSAISHFETGTRKPSFDNLRLLANVLSVTTDYLLGRVNDPTGHAEADILYRHLKNLTAEDRDLIKLMLDTLIKRNEKNKNDK